MGDAVFNTEGVIVVGPDTLKEHKDRATRSPSRRFRLCLHHSVGDPVHEMLNVFCKDTYIRPHRHPKGKSESYHMIEGEMSVLLFDDDGTVSRRIELGVVEGGRPFLYRVSSGVWHMPLPRTDFVIFHETFTGPFNKASDVLYADWAPEDTDAAGIISFLYPL